ncbi:MAG: phosphoadenosine phosphosulfate reductase family protein [Methanomicrobiales archaeon]|nr:phosphoadenosine phosphosulfate reductase family protein [Methanomicrobiales archaeon]NYT20646.1 phosphoadenosine phosphosulfate reductase family protein [Methanomicrobiales archaeon]
MRPAYLGKILLHWCDTCHVPVLSGVCGCGAATRSVAITPPGDARPAFPADRELVNRIYQDHFGAPLIPEGTLALLNKVPDTDRMEEVIMGGSVVGAIRYITGENRWEPLPRRESALFLQPSRRYVVVDEGAVPSIRDQGASVLAPGLRAIDPFVEKGDEVFILSPDGSCVGVGRAKVDAAGASSMERGAVVRTRKNALSRCIPGTSTWEDAVSANSSIIREAEEEAVGFVRQVAGTTDRPANVSYSGGKDSLATLLVVKKALGNVPLIFIDTGLEFPETLENVDVAAQTYGLEVVRASGEDAFWEAFERLGPPAMNYRWCCSACKLRPVRNLIEERWGECISFIGQRRYESVRRKESSRVFRNGIVTNQISAAPIHNWTALHVWLYIFREQAPWNPLYARGLDRIGCFMCPSSDVAVIEEIRKKYPELWREWSDRLGAWQEAHGLPPEWVTRGGWRIRGEVCDETDHYR